MNVSRLIVASLVVAVLLAVPVAPAAAQEGGEAAEESGEGGIEGQIEGFVEELGPAGAVAALLVGAVVLTFCVEKLISYLTRAALGLRVSLFTLAIVFTGIEFDDTVLALVLSAGDLEGAALGTALGTGLAIVGVTLALAAIVRPFPVDLPTDYVVLFALGPILLIPFVLAGTLTTVHGLALLGFFVLAFGYIVLRERQRDTPVFRNTDLGESLRADGGVTAPGSLSEIPEDRLVGGRSASGWPWMALAVLALAGIVFASMLLEAGSEVVVEGFGLEQTVFGATVLTAILTFEDVMLTIEPVRRGVPEIGVGNVIGSVLFSVTGNVGVIMLLSDLEISRSVLTFHLPSVILVTTLAAYFLYSGELKRWHGVVLGGLYAVYWVVAILVFGGVPIGG
ncbi:MULTISPECIES: sodium:calcium antiporter [unclassified Halorubrum]|uniref:sodium:calcium antiporter n=1 Tax=unclassified Halorubrum TaxID=2642239 RepID=UPI000B991150|nr:MULTISPECIES: sodium:proton exchanger [unclassified Halorubrum]OYR38487.1 sodium:proton exchanger [Halorubrum sp. Eb13]OYR55033.1 sodium:proton exchanger [Halorubrum sp. Ea1]